MTASSHDRSTGEDRGLHIGVLLVGSLLWERKNRREEWRNERLDLKGCCHVAAPIRYGRLSTSRSCTFTMTIDAEGALGQAVLVPCLKSPTDAAGLGREAAELWQAERPGSDAGTISASWGCVAAHFHDRRAPADWIAWWSQFFQANASPVGPVTRHGLLKLPWHEVSNDGLDLDVILATVTKAENKVPSAAEIAEAWLSRGHEDYFLENVKHGIRTPDDPEIWRLLEAANPKWLSNNAHAEAIAMLRGEATRKE